MVLSKKTDEYKKGKMIAVSVLVGLLILLLKIFQTEEISSLLFIYGKALGISFVAFIGLLWALKFQVTRRTLTFIITQPVVFIFCQTLFVELFLFRRVGRIYELLILVTALIVITGFTYISFAMANVFNVSAQKEIPLVQVSKTTSFILTLISTYFITFAVIESNFFVPITIGICSLVYFILTLLHFRHLQIPRNIFWKSVLNTLLMMVISLVIVLIVGKSSIIMAFTPLAVFYTFNGLQTAENVNAMQFIQYILLIIFSVLINFWAVI